MIHHAHPVTSGPSCIAYDNTRTTKDIVVTDLTLIRGNVTCPNCLADVSPSGNVTEEAAQAQNAVGYDPTDFSYVAVDPDQIFTDPMVIFTVVVCPHNATGDVTRRDNPYQPGFAMAAFGHFEASTVREYAEHQAAANGFVVVYPKVRYPRHLPAYRPIAYRDETTWYRVI